MKVLFLLPVLEPALWHIRSMNEAYPLGCAYLMGYLKAHGHEVDAIIDNYCTYEKYLSKLSDKIDTFKPDYVSITIYSATRVSSYQCIELCRERNIRVVVGGIHASAMPKQLHEKYPDIQIVVGEGERALLAIVSGCEDSILHYPLIEDLDKLPFPDHDTFLMENPGQTTAVMLTSRGCPMVPACSFCSLPSISNRKYRTRSVENVFEEIVYLKTKYPFVCDIGLQDDAFMMNNERVIALCKMLVDAGIKLDFWVSGRVKPITDEVLYWMDKAGMHFIAIGLETGNPEMLERAHKKIKLEDVEYFFKLAAKYPKIRVNTYLMTGLPGETWETVNTTIKFVNSLQKIKYDLIFDATPTFVYPGTELYELTKQAGQITDEYWLTDGDCPNYTVENSLETIKQMRKEILIRTSFLRVFTPRGFYYQFFNAPTKLLSLWWNYPNMIKYSLAESFAIMFPRLYRRLRGDKVEKKFEVL
jgi:anaerobic magnesium-protoporphyrin IX monomethyl ester cyclase